MTYPRRGEIHWVDFDPARGSEQAGRRPGLVISSDAANRLFSVVTLVAVTSQIKRNSRLIVVLAKGQPCKLESAVMPFQVITISNDRLDGLIGSLTSDQQTQVDEKLRLVWGL